MLEDNLNSTAAAVVVNLCALPSASLNESEPVPCSALADTQESYASKAGLSYAY